MPQDLHIAVLKRAGAILLAVGVIDIGVMIYCIAHEISYSSSFNILAVIAGVFLLRGSLRAASLVRWFAVFMLFGLGGMLLAWPFVQPLDLTLVQLRLSAWGTLLLAGTFVVLLFVLLAWLVRTLGRQEVLAAQAAAGLQVRRTLVPALVGVALVGLLLIFMALMLGGESAAKAKQLAEQQLGPRFSYHVGALNIASGTQGTSVHGVVVAWTADEIRRVPVSWTEP